MLKILKYKMPRPLYDMFTLSERNAGTLLILPLPSDSLAYKGPKIWNTAVKILAKDSDIPSIKVGSFKIKLKECLLDVQSKFDIVEWCQYNFMLETAKTT